MELRIYLQMLLRSWWIVILTALSALAIALAAIYFVSPIYKATTRLIVSPNFEVIEEAEPFAIVDSLNALDRRSIVATYAEVINSIKIFEQAVNGLGMTLSSVEDYRYSTVVLPDANILELSVEGPDPRVVTQLTNSIGAYAMDYIQDLYGVYTVDVLDPATIPVLPIRPQPVRDTSLALALGLIVGAVLAILREQVRTPLEVFLRRTQVDSISTAFNRRFFEDKLDDFTTASPDSLVALGLVRLDGLPSYLQILPHPIIQQLLRQITGIMREQLRGNDIIGRWDDHTFSIMLPNTPGEAALRTLERLQVALSTPMRYSADSESVDLEPKVGIGERLAGDTASLVIERAESALNEAEHDESGIVLYKTRPLIGF